MKTLKLSLAAAEWLVRDSGLEVTAMSPLGFLLGKTPSADPQQRAAAAQAELAGVGVTFGAQEPGAEAAPFRQAVELLADPVARLQVVTQAAGKAPIKMTLFARAGQACAFVSDRESFQIGPRRALDATFAAIQEQVRAPPELEGKQILFWPSVLQVMVMLWPGAGRDLDQRLDLDEARRRLGLPAEAQAQAKALVAELADKGLLSWQDRGLTVPTAFRPWLQAALSGQLVQLDVLPLDGAEALEKAEERTVRLLFVGAPGARVLSRSLAGDELTQILKGADPIEPRAIHLSALAPAGLADLLRVHLGLSPAPGRV